MLNKYLNDYYKGKITIGQNRTIDKIKRLSS